MALSVRARARVAVVFAIVGGALAVAIFSSSTPQPIAGGAALVVATVAFGYLEFARCDRCGAFLLSRSRGISRATRLLFAVPSHCRACKAPLGGSGAP